MKSNMLNHQFSLAPQANIERSVFNRTHAYKTTFDAGWLIPFYADEALPGDTFKMHASLFVRLLSPLGMPIMDNMIMDVHFFAVPLRLVWDNFKYFMGEKPDPDYVNTHTLTPLIIPTNTSIGVGTLLDYLGIPVGIDLEGGSVEIVAFHTRAYNLIFNEWYRDQNFQDSLTVDKDDGPDAEEDYVLRRRNKRHDYFTSCLPWPQKGDAIEIPLGTTAPVVGDGYALRLRNNDMVDYGFTVPAETHVPAYFEWNNTVGGETVSEVTGMGHLKAMYVPTSGVTGLVADLSSASAATINSLRLAFQMQKMAEKDARGGTRLIEIIRSHFQVISPDFRMQRPELLGSCSIPLNITQVAQTGAAASTEYKGSLSGYSQTFGQCGFHHSFVEHCVVLGILSVRADMTYSQGLRRMWSRRTKYDFYWPSLAHIGEQAVLNKELFCAGTVDDENVFGYQARFDEYRYFPSLITGKLRHDASGTLDYWHLSQYWETACPDLGETFIQEDPPIDRVIKVPAEPHFLLDSMLELVSARPMPVYSIPGKIDHL